jgi:hypothetical protein
LDYYILIGFLILVFLGIPVGVGLLLYFVPKKLGYPKLAKYLTIAYSIFVLLMVLFLAFIDRLFTNEDANRLIKEQGFKFKDEFTLQKNESSFGIGEYYHTFTLKISKRDKLEAILKIKSSTNFYTSTEVLENPTDTLNHYFGPKIIWNYENENSFVREYFQPSGKKDYAPTYRRISISKTKNELKFEDIDE